MPNPSNSDLVGETRLEIGLRKLRDYRGGAVLSDAEADAVTELAQQLEQAEQREAQAKRFLDGYCEAADPDPRADDDEEITIQDAYVLSAIAALTPDERADPPVEAEEEG